MHGSYSSSQGYQRGVGPPRKAGLELKLHLNRLIAPKEAETTPSITVPHKLGHNHRCRHNDSLQLSAWDRAPRQLDMSDLGMTDPASKSRGSADSALLGSRGSSAGGL